MRSLFLSLALVLLWHSAVSATTINVSSNAQLTSALSTAVAGDEIVLADGTYTGLYTINGNAGTSGAPITLRAANRHQAVMVGDNVCDRFHDAFRVQRDWWIIKEVLFRDYGRAININADHVEIANNVIDHWLAEGIRIDRDGTLVQFANIHDNVIAHEDAACAASGETAVGIQVVNNADNNTVANNLVIAAGDNGYQCGGGGGCSVGTKAGYGMLVGDGSDDNLIQGNLFLGNAGKGVFRILSGNTAPHGTPSADRNIVRDNAALFGEGSGFTTDDCTDDSNQFLNNIAYGNYYGALYTKGNPDGTKGHHTFQHNLLYATEFSHATLGITTGGCTGTGSPKAFNIVKDNLVYSNSTMTAPNDAWILADIRTEATAIATKSNNLFWAPSATGTWVSGYTYTGTDIHASGSQPVFVNAAQGDFSLAPGSPGKGAASDSTDIGVQYNTFLKKGWLGNVFTLPTQQTTGLAGVTSTSFAVNATRFYQVWFYVPTSSPCGQTDEAFLLESISLHRDMTALVSSNWVQPGGPARWITLGRHKATDGTLNVSWQHTNCVDQVFVRELPTALEAYNWILQAKQFRKHHGIRSQ